MSYISISIYIYITHINAHSDADIYLLWVSWVVNRPPGRSGGLVQLTAGRGDSQRPPAKDGADWGPGTPKYQKLIEIACWILGWFVFLATSCSFSKINYLRLNLANPKMKLWVNHDWVHHIFGRL